MGKNMIIAHRTALLSQSHNSPVAVAPHCYCGGTVLLRQQQNFPTSLRELSHGSLRPNFSKEKSAVSNLKSQLIFLHYHHTLIYTIYAYILISYIYYKGDVQVHFL